jgi:hypothetical protein
MGRPVRRTWAIAAAVVAAAVPGVQSHQSAADLPFDLYQGHLIVIKGS